MPVLLCIPFSWAITRWKLALHFHPFHLGKVLRNSQDYSAITSQHASNFVMAHLMKINLVYISPSLNCLISLKEAADWLSFHYKKERVKCEKENQTSVIQILFQKASQELWFQEEYKHFCPLNNFLVLNIKLKCRNWKKKKKKFPLVFLSLIMVTNFWHFYQKGSQIIPKFWK